MKTMIFALAAATLPIAALAAQPMSAPAQDRMNATDRPSRVQTRGEVVGHVRTMFARLDANRDGFLTQEEARSGRAQAVRAGQPQSLRRNHAERAGRAFDRFDANRDGAISRAEWDAHTAQRQQRRAALSAQGRRPGQAMRARGVGLGGRMFEMADVNRDNRVSMAEAQSAALQRFDRADLNRDGALTPDERRHHRQQRRAEPRRS